MGLRHQIESTPTQTALPESGRPAPRAVVPPTPPVLSPARELQAALESTYESSPEPVIARWPGAVRMAVICGGSGLMWLGLIALGRTVFKT